MLKSEKSEYFNNCYHIHNNNNYIGDIWLGLDGNFYFYKKEITILNRKKNRIKLSIKNISDLDGFSELEGLTCIGCL